MTVWTNRKSRVETIQEEEVPLESEGTVGHVTWENRDTCGV